MINAAVNVQEMNGLFELRNSIYASASRTVDFFINQITSEGSYANATDLACYYKSPMMFISAGRPELAYQMLSYIQEQYLQIDGDFRTSPTLKSIKPEYNEFWSYANGWIIRAAQKLYLGQIVKPAYDYFQLFHVGEGEGFLTYNLQERKDSTDILTAAHHGLVHLEMGNQALAQSAGEYLCHVIEWQNNIGEGFYCKFDLQHQPITQGSPFCFISKHDADQFYFMLGYPSAFLAKLYQQTENPEFLRAAKYYLDYALSCHSSVLHSNFSHKIAWAAGIIYSITKEEKYLPAIHSIANHFIESQSEQGLWYEDMNTAYDQSAEIACWFLDIARNLK